MRGWSWRGFAIALPLFYRNSRSASSAPHFLRPPCLPFAFSHSSIRSSTSFPFLTILWSPHALWALALVYLGYIHLPSIFGAKAPRTAYIASALLAVCLPMYVLYALYFCQVTMLHSDEGQYLRVTQSLLHDGDMDLANNLSAEQVREFHVIDFPLVKTPAAPEGKVHSTHPIGLSHYPGTCLLVWPGSVEEPSPGHGAVYRFSSKSVRSLALCIPDPAGRRPFGGGGSHRYNGRYRALFLLYQSGLP